ncbi:unnamed protein product [Durusdinium trenchii]|uniref:Fe2OG dioxygenase domain-containing protein n=1 Tax=Durusdinium trenchii TaxID=1381693 RepID=A0ABP0HMR6_9DINO
MRRLSALLAAWTAGRCLLVPLLGDPPALSGELERIAGPSPEEDLALLRGFLSSAELHHALAAGEDPKAWAIDDRDDELGYAHEVWRMEEVMQMNHPSLFQKLIDSAWSIERRMWGNILEFVFPEIEYIDYNVQKLAKPGSIARHADNDSMVTMVALLSDQKDFQGGVNCFDGSDRPRQVPLQQGDAVFFFGDRCHHWITQGAQADERRVGHGTSGTPGSR